MDQRLSKLGQWGRGVESVDKTDVEKSAVPVVARLGPGSDWPGDLSFSTESHNCHCRPERGGSSEPSGRGRRGPRERRALRGRSLARVEKGGGLDPCFLWFSHW